MASYERFIPREEVNAFAAWNPSELGRPHAPEPTAAAAAPKADPLEEVAARVHAARQSGYQDGYRDGLAALDGFKQSFAMQTTAQIGQLLQAFQQGLGDVQQDMARTLALCAAHLARQIVRTELTSHPQHIAAVAQEALETLMLSAQHISLRVNPQDHALVAQGAGEALAARGVRLLADAAISRGGCLVESDIGVIDGSVETRWRRAVATLGCDEAWEAGPQLPKTEVAAEEADKP
jgi:flagellar assembly protein FliH